MRNDTKGRDLSEILLETNSNELLTCSIVEAAMTAYHDI